MDAGFVAQRAGAAERAVAAAAGDRRTVLGLSKPSRADAEPLHILQVNSLFHGGGIDSQTLELGVQLAGLGNRVVIAAPDHSTWRELERPVDGVTVAKIAGGKAAWVLGLRRLIRAHRIDVVHAHYGRDNWVACIAARSGGAAAVISRHLMTPLSTGSAAWLLQLADVTAASKAVYRVLEGSMRGPRSHLHLLYGGIDTLRFAPDSAAGRALRQKLGWDAGHVVFALVGSAHPPGGKGQIEFAEAAAVVLRQLPQARFLSVGDGRLQDELRRRAEALGIGGCVAVLPFQHDVAPVFGAIDVLVHPAVGSEALGLVLWEAMACAKPVVASRLDGIPEAFVEGVHGLLVPPGDIPALAVAMLALGTDAALRQRFGSAGRSHVEALFSSRHYAERTQSLYRAILARRRAAA
jgi:glycosyltransferase involved in cell wall biosynthesis